MVVGEKFWLVVAGFGWAWLVVGHCGWFWLVPHFSMYAKRMLTYCEEVSETLRLLLYNKNGVAKGSETLCLVFHKKNSYLL